MIKAYAASEANGELTPFEYDPGQLGHHEVEIAVAHCGVCHSDMSMWQNEWGVSSYPFVGGHEVAGTVAAVGAHVTGLKIGDRVGLGWQSGYCNHCMQCLGGNHNLCPDQQPTIIGHHGGFADRVRAQETAVIRIPDRMALHDAGPLLCGGITVFNPFVQFGIRPTDHVAVIGIGGLGHLALQFARAWGCEVTAFTSESKMDEAREMGAHHCINSRDADAIAGAEGRFDLVLSTVAVKMDWNAILNTLKPQGRLHMVGISAEPMDVAAFPLVAGQRSISGSPVGAPATLNMMMEFAARHDISPVTEHFPMSKINEAFQHLEEGKARYRVVLDNAQPGA